ncbi:MAG: putative gamma-glutamyltranspeptidase [Thermoleophilia bacterium]|nr:putative gamma-glutamyltranspeptidase [Thermoleophilia bacterium]MCZ4495722.1 putative gamma-glutamyltranspeptidase [Thermoleophilia bacterium]
MVAARAGGAGAVAAGHEEVARVGATVLADGGNAVDAVVAMVAAGCVCENTLTSFGGGGFLIAGGGSLDKPVMLDFFSRQPGLELRPWLGPWEIHALELDGIVLPYGTGPASVAVPGIPRGLAHATERLGRRSLRELFAPAAALAQEGVTLTRTQAGEHAANGPLIMRDTHGGSIYGIEDGFRGEGDVFRQPALAAAIEELAATNAESFYTGNIAHAFMAWSDHRGARVSRTDLERYQVIEREPTSLVIDDIRVYANPGPSMGGGIAVQLLQAARAQHVKGTSRELSAAIALQEVIARLDPPRTRVPADGEIVRVPTVTLSSDRAHDAVADTMHDRGIPTDAHGEAPGFARSPNTTHVSAIDADGMVCGATTTVGYGSGEFIPGTGIQLNNMLAEYDHTIVRPPGSTVPSMMTPAILASPRTLVQVGSAGSDRIPHAIAQVFQHMWDGLTLEEAILAPRLSYDGTVMHAEPGFDDETLTRLRETIEVVEWSKLDPYFGTTNGTATRNGRSYAAGDPRREAAGIVL